jgi:ATP-dependent DNA helicase UvrD/PcrA
VNGNQAAPAPPTMPPAAPLVGAAARTWSAEQEAFYTEMAEGTDHVIVEAFAGTGKSTTIVEGGRRAPERRQLYCAFAKKNQLDLQAKLVGNPRAVSQTLHVVGLHTVGTFWEGLQIDKTGARTKSLVEAVCGGAAPDAVKRLVGKLLEKGREMAPHARQAGDLVDIAIEFDCQPGEQWEADGFGLDYVEARTLEAMDLAASKKPTATGIDFPDMLFLPVRNKWLRPRYDLVFVDERQDMTFTQLELAMGVGGGRIVLVGDVHQAIYGFRGADTNAAVRLREQLKAKVMTLSTTYRCPQAVVAQAQRLVPAYTAAPSAPAGTVRSVANTAAMLAALQPDDFILSRSNAPLAGVAMALVRAGRPVRIQGKNIGEGLQAIISKVATGKAADSIPELLRRLAKWEEREVARAEAAGKDHLVEGLRDKAETLRVVAEGTSGVRELRARLDHLFDDKRNGGTIVCSSVHKAKGLEAPRVFVLRYTLNPKLPQRVLDRMTDDQAAKRLQEERNIEYVAVTRSMDTLTWVEAK